MPIESDVTKYYIGETSPRISKTLSLLTGGSFDVQVGQTFTLMARARESGSISLSVLMQVDTVNDLVYYDPQDGDFEDAGFYKLWIHADLGSGVVTDTDEWDLVVLDHSPGVGVRTGAVAKWARRRAPVAWDALHLYEDYGDPGLQDIVELVKLNELPTGMVVPAPQEDALDIRVTNYLALRVAIEVIKVAIEYWTGQQQSRSLASGPAEVESYPDRIRAATTLLSILAKDIPDAKAQAEKALGVALGGSPSGIALIDGAPSITPGVAAATSGYRDGWDHGHGWWDR